MANHVIQDWTSTEVPMKYGPTRDVQYKVYKDLYGVNFAPRGDEEPLALRRDGEDARMPESVVWTARSRAESKCPRA